MDESEAQDTKLERIKENLENKNKETDTPEIPCNQGKNKDQENLVAEQDEEGMMPRNLNTIPRKMGIVFIDILTLLTITALELLLIF